MLGASWVSLGSEGIQWIRGVQALPRPRKEGARRECGGEEREIPAQCLPTSASSHCSAQGPGLPVSAVP